MDNINKTNRQRWNALANSNVEWSQPFLDSPRNRLRSMSVAIGLSRTSQGRKYSAWLAVVGKTRLLLDCWVLKSQYQNGFIFLHLQEYMLDDKTPNPVPGLTSLKSPHHGLILSGVCNVNK